MASFDIVDRASLIAGLSRELVLDQRQTAIVTIDMHRGHLDMDVATMPTKPENAKRVIANARTALDFARDVGIPVIHVILVYRRIPGLGSEGTASPFWQAMHAAQGELDRLVPGRKSTVREHNLEGSPGTQIIPALYASGDYVIGNKKRLDCFYGTDLRQLLDTLGVKNVVLMGINTNTCVLNTFQPRLQRGGALRLRRQHVRRGPARPRAAECRALPRLGPHQRAVLRQAPRGGAGGRAGQVSARPASCRSGNLGNLQPQSRRASFVDSNAWRSAAKASQASAIT